MELVGSSSRPSSAACCSSCTGGEHDALRPVARREGPPIQLTNFADDGPDLVKKFGAGSSFSGVYDLHSGSFMAIPSGDTVTLAGEIPAGRVELGGGHALVNEMLRQKLGVARTAPVDFNAVMQHDGAIALDWRFPKKSSIVPFLKEPPPDHVKVQVVAAVTKATGRTTML